MVTVRAYFCQAEKAIAIPPTARPGPPPAPGRWGKWRCRRRPGALMTRWSSAVTRRAGCTRLERIAKGGKHGWSFLAKADVDAPDDARSDHGPEPKARVHGEVPGRHVDQIPGDLADVDEGRELPVRVHVEEPVAKQPDPLLDVQEQIAAVDEAVVSVPSQRVLAAEDAPLEKWHVGTQRLVVGHAHGGHVPRVFQRKEALQLDRVVAIVRGAPERLRGHLEDPRAVQAPRGQIRMIERAERRHDPLGVRGKPVDPGDRLRCEQILDRWERRDG